MEKSTLPLCSYNAFEPKPPTTYTTIRETILFARELRFSIMSCAQRNVAFVRFRSITQRVLYVKSQFTEGATTWRCLFIQPCPCRMRICSSRLLPAMSGPAQQDHKGYEQLKPCWSHCSRATAETDPLFLSVVFQPGCRYTIFAFCSV